MPRPHRTRSDYPSLVEQVRAGGVVGMGGIGNTHAACHGKDPLAKLVAVCDIIRERADAGAAKFGVKAFYSLEDMLANVDVDIVDVTT